ncbi:hypothetical protein CEXT_590051 [Caerostris extrusa]|uniref:Ycf15 n=1 Tax=Caerostris extrusa TaxID=172846 RepID=A0AAV4UWC7_CAEEX|nr:hypothetical protein CEXT_590051 [Caerostris extrusa]
MASDDWLLLGPFPPYSKNNYFFLKERNGLGRDLNPTSRTQSENHTPRPPSHTLTRHTPKSKEIIHKNRSCLVYFQELRQPNAAVEKQTGM